MGYRSRRLLKFGSVQFGLKIRVNGLRRLFAGAHKRHRTRLKAMGRFDYGDCEQHAGDGYSRTESISAEQCGKGESHKRTKGCVTEKTGLNARPAIHYVGAVCMGARRNGIKLCLQQGSAVALCVCVR